MAVNIVVELGTIGVQSLRVGPPPDNPVHIVAVQSLGDEVGVECKIKIIRLIWQRRRQSGKITLRSESEEFGYVGHDRGQSLIEVALYRYKDRLCKVGAEISELNDLRAGRVDWKEESSDVGQDIQRIGDATHTSERQHRAQRRNRNGRRYVHLSIRLPSEAESAMCCVYPQWAWDEREYALER